MSHAPLRPADSRQAVLAGLRQARNVAGNPAPAKMPRRPEPTTRADAPTLAKALESSGFEAPVCRTSGELAAALARIVADNAVKTASVWNHPLLERLDVAGLLERAGVAVVWAQQPDDAPGCSCRRAAEADLGVCAADALVADTGSIVMRAGEGRPRATALLPQALLVVCDPDDALADLTAMADFLDEQAKTNDPSAFFCVTGPSGTGDIEFVLVKGAHGPPTVITLLAERGKE